jgi:hypothetical protein
MTNMVVAYHVPHNEGVEYGIFTKSGQDTNLTLVDLYEVDGRIRTFDTVEEAQEWLRTYGLDEVTPDQLFRTENIGGYLCATCSNTHHRMSGKRNWRN